MKLSSSKYLFLSYTHSNGVYRYLGVFNKISKHLEVLQLNRLSASMYKIKSSFPVDSELELNSDAISAVEKLQDGSFDFHFVATYGKIDEQLGNSNNIAYIKFNTLTNFQIYKRVHTLPQLAQTPLTMSILPGRNKVLIISQINQFYYISGSSAILNPGVSSLGLACYDSTTGARLWSKVVSNPQYSISLKSVQTSVDEFVLMTSVNTRSEIQIQITAYHYENGYAQSYELITQLAGQALNLINYSGKMFVFLKVDGTLAGYTGNSLYSSTNSNSLDVIGFDLAAPSSAFKLQELDETMTPKTEAVLFIQGSGVVFMRYTEASSTQIQLVSLLTNECDQIYCVSCLATDTAICLECTTSLEEGVCVSSCSLGYFLNSQGLCQKCHPSCSQCDAYGRTECIACPGDRVLTDTSCYCSDYDTGRECVANPTLEYPNYESTTKLLHSLLPQEYFYSFQGSLISDDSTCEYLDTFVSLTNKAIQFPTPFSQISEVRAMTYSLWIRPQQLPSSVQTIVSILGVSTLTAGSQSYSATVKQASGSILSSTVSSVSHPQCAVGVHTWTFVSVSFSSQISLSLFCGVSGGSYSYVQASSASTGLLSGISSQISNQFTLGGDYNSGTNAPQVGIFNAYYSQFAVYQRFFSYVQIADLVNLFPRPELSLIAYWPLTEPIPSSSSITFKDHSFNRQEIQVSTFDITTSKPGFTLTLCRHSISLQITETTPARQKGTTFDSISLMNYYKFEANNQGHYLDIIYPGESSPAFTCFLLSQNQDCSFNLAEGKNVQVYFSSPKNRKIFRGSGMISAILSIEPLSVIGTSNSASSVTFTTQSTFNSLREKLMMGADCTVGLEIVKSSEHQYLQTDLSNLSEGNYVLCWESPLSDAFTQIHFFKGIKIVQKLRLVQNLIPVPHTITVQTSLINYVNISPELEPYSRIAIVPAGSACDELNFVQHSSGMNYRESTGPSFEAIYFGKFNSFSSQETVFYLCVSGGASQNYFPVYESNQDTIYEFSTIKLIRDDIEFPELIAAEPRYGGSLTRSQVVLHFNHKMYGVVNSGHPDETGKILVVESNQEREPVLSSILKTIKFSQFENDLSSIPDLRGTQMEEYYQVGIDVSKLSLVEGTYYFLCIYPQTLASLDSVGNSMFFLGQGQEYFPIKYCHLFQYPVSQLTINSQEVIAPQQPRITIAGSNLLSYQSWKTLRIQSLCFFQRNQLKETIISQIQQFTQNSLTLSFYQVLEFGQKLYCDLYVTREDASMSSISTEYFTDLNIGVIGCISPCLTCTSSPSLCSTCEAGVLFNQSCLNQCPEDTPLHILPDFNFILNTECRSSCPDGYFQENQICLHCPHNQCKSCVDANECTECFNGLYLFNGICVEECPFNTVSDLNRQCDASDISLSSQLIIVEPFKSLYSFQDSIKVDLTSSVQNPQWTVLSPRISLNSNLFIDIENSSAKTLDPGLIEKHRFRTLTIACSSAGTTISGINTIYFEKLPDLASLTETHSTSEVGSWTRNSYVICSNQLYAQEGFAHYYFTFIDSQQNGHVITPTSTIYQSQRICAELSFIELGEAEQTRQGIIRMVVRSQNLNKVQKSIQVDYSTSRLGNYFQARQDFTSLFPELNTQNLYEVSSLLRSLYYYPFPRQNMRECVFDSECGERGKCLNSECACDNDYQGFHCQFQAGHSNSQTLASYFDLVNDLSAPLDLIHQFEPMSIYLDIFSQLLQVSQIDKAIAFFEKIQSSWIANLQDNELTYLFEGLSSLFEAIKLKLPSPSLYLELKKVKILISSLVQSLFNKLSHSAPLFTLSTHVFEAIIEVGKISELSSLLLVSDGVGVSLPRNTPFQNQISYFKVINWKRLPRTSDLFTLSETLEVEIFNGYKQPRSVTSLSTPVTLFLKQTPFHQSTQLVQCLFYQQTMEISTALSTGCVYRGNLDKLIVCQCNHLSQFIAIFTGAALSRYSAIPNPIIVEINYTKFFESLGFIYATIFCVVYLGSIVAILVRQSVIRRRSRQQKLSSEQTNLNEIPQELLYILKQKRKSFILNARQEIFKDNAIDVNDTTQDISKQTKRSVQEEVKVRYCSLLFNTYAVVDLVRNKSLAHSRSSRLTLFFLKNALLLLLCVSTFALLQDEDENKSSYFVIALGLYEIPIKLFWSNLHKIFRSSQDTQSISDYKKIKRIWWPLVMILANFIILVCLYFMVKRSMNHRQQASINGLLAYIWCLVFEIAILDPLGILIFYKSLGRKKYRCWRNYLHYTVMLKLGLRI